MEIFGRKVGIAKKSSFRKKKDAAVAVGVTPKTKLGNETLPPLSQPRRISPLSALVSKFITENARNIHDSIKDEKERRDFVFDLCETLDSVGDGKERPSRRSLSSASSVIDFFVETTKNTLDSIEDEEEQIAFEEHLTRALRQSFQYKITMIQ